MGLKAEYETLDDVPEQFHELYEERDGKFLLTQIEGVKTEADVRRVQEGARKERDEHKKTRERLKSFEALGDPDEVQQKLDRYPELEAAADGKVDDAKLEQLVESRLRTKLGPIEREKKQLAEKLGETESQLTQFQQRDRQRSIHDAIRSAAAKAKILPSAVEDALMLGERQLEIDDDARIVTRDSVGVTPGVDVGQWLQEVQEKRPHWWPGSQGAGAGGGSGGAGGGGANPWSAKGWNMTAQGAVLRESPEKAERLAKAAGTTVGGPRPTG